MEKTSNNIERNFLKFLVVVWIGAFICALYNRINPSNQTVGYLINIILLIEIIGSMVIIRKLINGNFRPEDTDNKFADFSIKAMVFIEWFLWTVIALILILVGKLKQSDNTNMGLVRTALNLTSSRTF
jgi:hypothetical protein